MKKSPKVIVSIALATLFAFSSLSFAQEKQRNAPNGVAPAVQAGAPTTLYTTKAKLAYFYSRGFGAPRSKGVASFSNPATGIYCITPSASVTLDFTKIQPLLSIEWGSSLGSSLLAYWRDPATAFDCPGGSLEVQTYDFNSGGAAVPSTQVSFNLVII